MKSPTSEAWCAKVVFQIQLPICAGNVSTNISIPNARINMRKSEHDTIFEISLTINLKDKSFHDSIECSWFYLQVYILYLVSRLLEYTCETFASPWHNLTINPHVEQHLTNLPKQVCLPHEKLFLEKNPPYFNKEGETLCNYIYSLWSFSFRLA